MRGGREGGRRGKAGEWSGGREGNRWVKAIDQRNKIEIFNGRAEMYVHLNDQGLKSCLVTLPPKKNKQKKKKTKQQQQQKTTTTKNTKKPKQTNKQKNKH